MASENVVWAKDRRTTTLEVPEGTIVVVEYFTRVKGKILPGGITLKIFPKVGR